jgi:hypothetical protein
MEQGRIDYARALDTERATLRAIRGMLEVQHGKKLSLADAVQRPRAGKETAAALHARAPRRHMSPPERLRLTSKMDNLDGEELSCRISLTVIAVPCCAAYAA